MLTLPENLTEEYMFETAVLITAYTAMFVDKTDDGKDVVLAVDRDDTHKRARFLDGGHTLVCHTFPVDEIQKVQDRVIANWELCFLDIWSDAEEEDLTQC